MRVDKAGELCFTGLSLELFVPVCSSWMARPHQGCTEIEEPPGSRGVKWSCRLEVAWPVCEVLVVCSVFQWGTHLTRQVGTNSHWVVPSLPGSFFFIFLTTSPWTQFIQPSFNFKIQFSRTLCTAGSVPGANRWPGRRQSMISSRIYCFILYSPKKWQVQ